MERIRQIREIILIRQTAEFKRQVRVQQSVVQQLASATYGAAGNKRGANQAAKIKLIPDDDETPGGKKPKVASVNAVSQAFPVDRKYGVYSQDEIEARMRELAAQDQE